MNCRPRLGVRIGLTQDLAGDGRDVSLTEDDEAGQVLQRVPLDPAEVGVRFLPVRSRMASKVAASPLGTDALSTWSTRNPEISLPLTLTFEAKSEASFTVTSRKSTESPAGMWLASRSSRSLTRYSRVFRSSGDWRSAAMCRASPPPG